LAGSVLIQVHLGMYADSSAIPCLLAIAHWT